MKKDFVPHSYGNLIAWLTNLQNKLGDIGSSYGLTPAQVTAGQNACGAINYALHLQDAAQIALDAATEEAENRVKDQFNGIPFLRDLIGIIKNNPNYTTAIGDDFDIIGTEVTIDPTTYKPELKATAMNGHVRLVGRKRGVASMNVYLRLDGETEWKRVAERRSRFPFDDTTPLKVAGTPETREYRIFGVVADEEIGLPSDVAVVTYGG